MPAAAPASAPVPAEEARVPVAQEPAALVLALATAELAQERASERARVPEEAEVAPAVVTPTDSPCKCVRRRSQHQRACQRCWARRPLQWFRWRCRYVLTQS